MDGAQAARPEQILQRITPDMADGGQALQRPVIDRDRTGQRLGVVGIDQFLGNRRRKGAVVDDGSSLIVVMRRAGGRGNHGAASLSAGRA